MDRIRHFIDSNFSRDVRANFTVKGSPGSYVDFPENLNPEIKKILLVKFPESIYNDESPNIFYKSSFVRTDEFKQFEEQIKDSIENVAIDALNIDIKSIRIVNTNNEIRKCDCEADIYSEDSKVNSVAYSAQYTEDETIYVTLSFE